MTIDFENKSINDPVHGSIKLSKLEHKLINTSTFLRLARLSQHGLVNLVFPGATHSRFSHSLGAMHVVSLMIDAINRYSCSKSGNSIIDDQEKQLLRVCALLHDIGHYPLSHVSEFPIYRYAIDSQEESTSEDFIEDKSTDQELPLNIMAKVSKFEDVSHERLGGYIIQNREEIIELLHEFSIDPVEVSKIVKGELDQPHYRVQLIGSTIDADRLDFLLRDSLYSGVCYGHIDLNFLISNIVFDDNAKRIAIDKKAINALEHFVISRYYMYNNITYHKTVVGMELIAKHVYFKMGKHGHIEIDYEDIKQKAINQPNWFCEYDDIYFWSKVRGWEPDTKYDKMARYCLLNRIPPILVHEERETLKFEETDVDSKYSFLSESLLTNSIKFESLLTSHSLSRDAFALLQNSIKFESHSPFSNHNTRTDDQDVRKLAKVLHENEIKNLIDVQNSAIHYLSQFKFYIKRLFYFDYQGKFLDRNTIKDLFRDNVMND